MFGPTAAPYDAFADTSKPPLEPRIAFWRDQKAWPKDTEEFAFVGRVVLDLGKSMYGEEWQDDDPAVPFVLPLVDHLNLYTGSAYLQRASEILMAHHAPYAERSQYAFMGDGPDFPSRDEWKIACAIDKRRYQEELRRFTRFYGACNRLLALFAAGKVKTARRGYYGGEFKIQEPDFWNGEHVIWRFDTCRVDPAQPFGPQGAFNGTGDWIFIKRSTFYQLPAQDDAQPSQSDIKLAEKAVEQREHRRARSPGRKQKFNWDEMMSEYLRMFQIDGIPDPDNLSEQARRLAVWAAQQWDEPPEEKTIQAKLRVWLSAVRQA